MNPSTVRVSFGGLVSFGLLDDLVRACLATGLDRLDLSNGPSTGRPGGRFTILFRRASDDTVLRFLQSFRSSISGYCRFSLVLLSSSLKI